MSRLSTIAPSTKAVAYYRVSTREQGLSGLGLEGQETAVTAWAKYSGATIIKSFTEIESGKNPDRKQLANAIRACNRMRARLVIAKLDRLSRNLFFIAQLMETNVDFVACDNPTANRLTVHILAAVAENEARAISERTKAALAARKARGDKLGGQIEACRNLKAADLPRAWAASADRRRQLREQADDLVIGSIKSLRAERMTYGQIAAALNAEGSESRSGQQWNATQISRVLKRNRAF